MSRLVQKCRCPSATTTSLPNHKAIRPLVAAQAASAEVLNTHRIPALLAVEAASESVDVCAKQGYLETAVVVDADGATIVALRGDGAGIHTLDSAHDKAYTSVSFKSDTIAWNVCLAPNSGHVASLLKESAECQKQTLAARG